MKKLLVIVGPTGTGKTNLALALAKKFSGELISADSRQIYQGMDVGTGKVDPGKKIEKNKGYWEVDGVKIHLFDLAKPDEKFSVAQFQELAYKRIDSIIETGNLPILVGGTGLYIQSIIEGLRIPKVAPDPKLRADLENKSTGRLLALLEEVDSRTFKKIDPNNRRRIIRALEVSYKTKKPFSEVKESVKGSFDTLIFGLTAARDKLYRRVDQRIESWFKKGEFQKEVAELLKKYPDNPPSFTSLGYQDVVALEEGRFSLETAVQRTKFKHHAYIRRQLTWFRKIRAVHWVDIDSLNLTELSEKVKVWRQLEPS